MSPTSKRERALQLTDKELEEIRRQGNLAGVAQVLGLSGRGTPDELLKAIKKEQRKAK